MRMGLIRLPFITDRLNDAGRNVVTQVKDVLNVATSSPNSKDGFRISKARSNVVVAERG